MYIKPLYAIIGGTIGVVVRMSILDTKVAGSNLSINMFSPWARDFIRIASVESAVKWVPGGDNLVKGVQCYELFGGIALKNHTFSFFIFIDIHSIIHHSFADDLQLHMSAPPDRVSELLLSMQSCICDVKAWATANMLKLNDNKT